jgi:hypothetical protein
MLYLHIPKNGSIVHVLGDLNELYITSVPMPVAFIERIWGV